MWEISEVGTKFLRTMKLVPLEDVGFQVSNNVKLPETSNASSFQFRSVRGCLGSR